MKYFYLIPILPFLGALFCSILYLYQKKVKNISDNILAIFGISTPIISTFLSILVFIHIFENPSLNLSINLLQWIKVGSFNINIAFYVDSLSAFMILFISFIASLIHIYSIGYMKGDENFGKFFIYLNLFTASMLILVLADNPILMFVGWEGVGVCSYLLIAFYYKDRANVIAGNKAFIMNRVGDFAFISGIMILFWQLGGVNSDFNYTYLSTSVKELSLNMSILISILLFIGATGKSAQIPLYTWLPDAMAGPTPVSALIHAATMVTAGVYLIARFSFLYSNLLVVGDIIAYIGSFTAFLAAIIATRQVDIKKILAYSTISQLGYMFMAVGIGAYSTGIFHVFTHAFFKALLFLCAGSIIYILHHEQNIFKMHNLKFLRVIYIPMLIATLAISGIFPFSGFFSKDEILLKIFLKEYYFMYILALFTAFLTAFYMFRLFFVSFHYKNTKHKDLGKLPNNMKYVLFILSLGAIFSGFVGIPEVFGGSNWIKHFLSFSLSYGDIPFKTISHSLEYILMIFGTLVSICGIFLAYKKYYVFTKKESNNYFTNIIKHKFYVDEFYEVLFVKSSNKLANFISYFLDNLIIYNIVNLFAYFVKFLSLVYSKLIQNGRLSYYTLYIVVAISCITFFIEIRVL